MARTCFVFLLGLVAAIKRITPHTEDKVRAETQITSPMHTVEDSALPSGLIQANADDKIQAKSEVKKEVKKEAKNKKNDKADPLLVDPRFLVQEKAPSLSTCLLIAAAFITTAIFVMFVVKNKYADGKSKGIHQIIPGSCLSTSSSDVTSSETGSTDKELKSRMKRFEERLENHQKRLQESLDEDGVSPADKKETIMKYLQKK